MLFLFAYRGRIHQCGCGPNRPTEASAGRTLRANYRRSGQGDAEARGREKDRHRVRSRVRDGRIVIAAAKDFGAHGVGIDINPVRIGEAKENARKAGVERLVRFEENDLFQADIHGASVVTIFLLSEINLKLRPKLLRELQPGTRLVSNTFDMGDWKPDKQATVGEEYQEDFLSHRLFLWLVPARRDK